MLRKVILNLKHFTSWFIKGEKKNPNQTRQPQKPVCNDSCYFSITIILFNKKDRGPWDRLNPGTV